MTGSLNRAVVGGCCCQGKLGTVGKTQLLMWMEHFHFVSRSGGMAGSGLTGLTPPFKGRVMSHLLEWLLSGEKPEWGVGPGFHEGGPGS